MCEQEHRGRTLAATAFRRYRPGMIVVLDDGGIRTFAAEGNAAQKLREATEARLGTAVSVCRKIWQEWRDSNPQPPVLETGALAN